MFHLEQGDRNMELIGLKVKHTVFGVGTITEKDGNYITVEFAAKTTKFVYPDAFEKFIKAEEPSVQQAITDEINDAKAASEQKRQAEEAARKAKEAEEADEESGGDLDLDLDLGGDEGEESSGDDLDLAPMPDSEIAEEGFKADESKTILVEDGALIENADDLPTPEEADTDRDFTENL
jgi:hypothetical protein